jgi:hypothetical protein
MVQQFRDGAVLNILLLFSVCSLWSQRPHTGATEEAMIKHVKNVDISSLDHSLPRVTLEFFLQYEGEGAPIKWSVVNCDRLRENPATEHEQDADICVKADIELKDNRSATVVVLPGKGTGTRSATVPSLLRVTVTSRDGLTHDIRQLRDLPMELRRPLPLYRPGPRDFSSPAAAA